MNITSNDITTIYRKRNRIGDKNVGTHAIVVSFRNRTSKIAFLKNCRKITNLNTSMLGSSNVDKRPLYVNYQLTKMSEFLLNKTYIVN